jgi:hypothetical protein
VGHVAAGDERKDAYRILGGNPETKGTLTKHRHEWMDNINEDL